MLVILAARQGYCNHWAYGLMKISSCCVVHIGGLVQWGFDTVVVVLAKVILFQLESG